MKTAQQNKNKRQLTISDELYDYMLKLGVHEHPVLTKLRHVTHKMPNAHMQIGPDQGQFMGLLAKIINAKYYLEIGVFTGYSSLSMALAMGKSSKVVALDNNDEHLNIARQFWLEANVLSQIEVFCAPALQTLAKLVNTHKMLFDIAFIDANKSDYLAYYEHCYKLIRSGGIILVDNVLFHGQVLEEKPAEFVQAIKKFNEFIYNDNRVEISMLSIGDGLTIIRKL